MFTRRFLIAATVVAVLTPGVYASQKIDGSYSINVDAAGNVTLTKPMMFPVHPSPTPAPTYKVVDARSANLLKALGPASVNLDGSVSGNTIKIRYVNGTVFTGSSFSAPVPLYAHAGDTATHRVLANSAQVMILAAQTVAGETWLQVQSKTAHNLKGWVKAANVSYRIFFALAHPATPGATGSIPQ
jgi:hypothetical protein